MLHGPPPGTPSLCRCPSRRMGQGVHMQECNLAGPQGRGLRRVGSIRLVGQMSHFSLCQGLASHALERGAHSTPRTFAGVLRTGISLQQQNTLSYVGVTTPAAGFRPDPAPPIV